MIRAILNADDFGIAPGVNRGIIECFRDGILTSTTMLVNLGFFEQAVELARQNPDLPVGIHLTLLWGPPVSAPDRVPTLVERDGCFPRSLGVLARRYYTRRLSLEQVRVEFRSQIERFLAAGLVPTHLDTHKHVHSLPGVMSAVIEVAGEFGIGRIRLPYEDGSAAPPGRPAAMDRAKRRLIQLLCRSARGRIERAELKTTDRFVGIDHMNCLNSEALRLILNHLTDGVTEIMCHPGYTDEHLTRFARVPPHREQELRSLTDPQIKRLVATNAIELTDYGKL